MAKTQKQIDEFFKAKQEQLETMQPRSQMILNDEPLPSTEDLTFVEMIMRKKDLLKDKDVVKHLQYIKKNSNSDVAVTSADILLNTKQK
jgi:hypothetical protein